MGPERELRVLAAWRGFRNLGRALLALRIKVRL